MVVDASVWVSALVLQEPHHADSSRWLDEQVASLAPLTIPSLFLAELAGALRRRTGSAAVARRAIQEVISTPGLRIVEIDLPLAQHATEIAVELAVRGADAVYVAVARRFDLPLVTWDQEVQTRCAGFIEVVHP